VSSVLEEVKRRKSAYLHSALDESEVHGIYVISTTTTTTTYTITIIISGM
jgi:hypothetical protein